MHACVVWLRHQYTAEENLLHRRRQKRRHVLYVVLPLSLLLLANSSWIILISSLTGFLLPEMWLLRGPRGGLNKKFSRLAIACHIFRPPHKLCCNSTTGHTLWPPNTWDLNPVDYKVWSVMKEVYKKRIKDIDELRARILTWDEMDQHIIDAAIRQWRTRLRHSCTY